MIRNLTRLVSIIKDFNNEECFADIRLEQAYGKLIRSNGERKTKETKSNKCKRVNYNLFKDAVENWFKW